MIRNPRKMYIVNSGDMSSQILSTPIDLSGNEGYAVQVAWRAVTGSGTLSLLASCDDTADFGQLGTVPIASSSMVVNSASGADMWNIQYGKYAWAQLLWVPATGGAAGVLIARATIK
jgi:hypothetical protein